MTETEGRAVRPAGWADAQTVLDMEVLDDDHVKVLWRCDFGDGDDPPGPFTVFHASEHVLWRPDGL